MNKLFWLLLLVIACAPVQEPAQEPVQEPLSTPTAPVSPVPAPVVVQKVQPEVEQVPVQVVPISEAGKCEQLGCPIGSTLVGDMKTDLYYACYCTFAKWLKPGDMLCFKSAAEASERGYRKAQSC